MCLQPTPQPQRPRLTPSADRAWTTSTVPSLPPLRIGRPPVSAGFLCSQTRRRGLRCISHPEHLAVAGLDLVALLLNGLGVLFQGLERAEWLAAVGLLGLRMQRAQFAHINNELLAFRGEGVALEQPRCVRVWRSLEDAVWSDHERRSLGRMDDLDRSF